MSKALQRKALWRLMMFRVAAGCRRVCSEIPGRSGSSQDPFGLNWEAVRVPYHSFNTQSCQGEWSKAGQGQLLSTISTRKLKWKPDLCVYKRVCLAGKEGFGGQQLLEDHLPHPCTAIKHPNLHFQKQYSYFSIVYRCCRWVWMDTGPQADQVEMFRISANNTTHTSVFYQVVRMTGRF